MHRKLVRFTHSSRSRKQDQPCERTQLGNMASVNTGIEHYASLMQSASNLKVILYDVVLYHRTAPLSIRRHTKPCTVLLSRQLSLRYQSALSHLLSVPRHILTRPGSPIQPKRKKESIPRLLTFERHMFYIVRVGMCARQLRKNMRLVFTDCIFFSLSSLALL